MARKVSANSVVITPKLQVAVLLALGATWLFQVSMSAYYLLRSAPYTDMSFWWFQSVYNLLPVVMFLVALWYVGKIGGWLNRVFKAALFALVGTLGSMFVMQLTIILPWWTSQTHTPGTEVVAYGATLGVYLVTLMVVKFQRGNRA